MAAPKDLSCLQCAGETALGFTPGALARRRQLCQWAQEQRAWGHGGWDRSWRVMKDHERMRKMQHTKVFGRKMSGVWRCCHLAAHRMAVKFAGALVARWDLDQLWLLDGLCGQAVGVAGSRLNMTATGGRNQWVDSQVHSLSRVFSMFSRAFWIGATEAFGWFHKERVFVKPPFGCCWCPCVYLVIVIYGCLVDWDGGSTQPLWGAKEGV